MNILNYNDPTERKDYSDLLIKSSQRSTMHSALHSRPMSKGIMSNKSSMTQIPIVINEHNQPIVQSEMTYITKSIPLRKELVSTNNLSSYGYGEESNKISPVKSKYSGKSN